MGFCVCSCMRRCVRACVACGVRREMGVGMGRRGGDCMCTGSVWGFSWDVFVQGASRLCDGGFWDGDTMYG